MPHDFPKWQTVYYYFRRWQVDGIWEKMHWFLRAEVRVKEGRNVEASAAIADTQSIKTVGPAIESGYDDGKNVKGRKRHILVDTLGLLLTVFVHDAHLIVRSMAAAAQTKHDLADLINVALEELVRAAYELPSFPVLVRAAKRVRAAVTQRFYRQVADQLNAERRANLNALFELRVCSALFLELIDIFLLPSSLNLIVFVS